MNSSLLKYYLQFVIVCKSRIILYFLFHTFSTGLIFFKDIALVE